MAAAATVAASATALEATADGVAPGPSAGSSASAPPLAPVDSASSLRVLELFAGIGGWRLALQEALPGRQEGSLNFEPYDSGPHCSEVYQRNFGEPCCRRNIEQLEPRELDGFDLWLMSPPCQPFSTTQDAKQLGLKDARCKALSHLCDVVPRLARPPRWIALENVKGFHGSDACERWTAVLQGCGYSVRQLLLDPVMFGVPNHRTRYYSIAERSGRFASGAAKAPAGESADAEAATGAAAPQAHWPHGLLLTGDWVKSLRRATDEAHGVAREAATREAREKQFAELRTLFRTALDTALLRAAPAAAAPAAPGAAATPAAAAAVAELLRDDEAWKLLPMPKERQDALVLAFGVDSDAPERLQELLQPVLAAEGFTCQLTSALTAAAARERSAASGLPARRVGEFLEDLSASEREELVVRREILQKPYAKGLSYVEPAHDTTFCFTGHYGKVMHKSSGSLLHVPDASRPPLDRADPEHSFGGVRLFSPKEILNMFGFPKPFSLPAEMPLRHRYKVVGNSISVTLGALVLRLLLLGQGDELLSRYEQAPPSAQLRSRSSLAPVGSPEASEA
eukprot:TRINITY_DN10915_c0_g1_i1.p1 TRINITY_DN10915_c0_g1~~TRINITY_DN10915_c0_g1_i1.p1  ORF type:complete len:599 (+),score=134.84 TRINITY_DN10915_c0_g1_i1:93-1799(+)